MDSRVRIFIRMNDESWAFIALNMPYTGNSIGLETWIDKTTGTQYKFKRACYTFDEATGLLNNRGLMIGPDIYRVITTGTTIATVWKLSTDPRLEVAILRDKWKMLPETATLTDIRSAILEGLGLDGSTIDIVPEPTTASLLDFNIAV